MKVLEDFQVLLGGFLALGKDGLDPSFLLGGRCLVLVRPLKELLDVGFHLLGAANLAFL